MAKKPIEKSQYIRNSWLFALWSSFWGIGILLRLYLAINYPIWLDEQYSLLFSWGKSAFELMVFSQDVHPGGYYLVLKSFLMLTTDLAALRIFSSVLPQLLGFGLLTYVVWRKRPSVLGVTIFQAFLLLNPFFIFLAAQLRMYGFVCLLASLTIIAWQKWKENQQQKYFWALLIVLLIGNAFSYSFFFLTGGVAVWLFYDAWVKKHSWWQSVLLSALTFIEFVTLAGVAVKKPFEYASWIPLPNISNLPILVLNIFGLEHNPWLVPQQSVLSAIFYLVVASGGYFLFRLRAKISIQSFWSKWKELLIVCALPAVGILVASVLLPFLSQRFWFYQFVPKLSLFLPRVFLPLVCVASYLLAISTGRFSLKKTRYAIVLCGILAVLFVFRWAGILKNILSEMPNQRQTTAAQMTLLENVMSESRMTKKMPTVMPSFIWVTYITPDHAEFVDHVKEQKLQTEKLEQALSAEGEVACLNLPEKVVFSKAVFFTISSFYDRIERSLNKCCAKITFPGAEKAWQCTQ